MFNENNIKIKKSRNLNVISLPKISQTYTLFKKGVMNNNLFRNKKKLFNNEKAKITYFNYKLIQKNLLKYKTSIKRYEKIIINNLIASIKNHDYANFRDKLLIEFKGEFLKRFYQKKECFERIQKFAKYYKNYLLFFCKSTFRNLYYNKLIHNYHEKKARIYYKIHKKKNDENNDNIKQNYNVKNEENSLKIIFDKTVRKNIDKNSLDFIKTFNSNFENKTIPEKTSFHSYKESNENSIKSLLNLFKIEKEENKKDRIRSVNNKNHLKNVKKKEKINTDINYLNIQNRNNKKKIKNFKPVIHITNISPNILKQMKLKSLKYLKKNSFSESHISKINKEKSKENLSNRIVNKRKTRNLKRKPYLNLDNESLTSRIVKTDTQFLTSSKEFSVERNSSSVKNKSKGRIKLSDFITKSTFNNLKLSKRKKKNFNISITKENNSSKKEKSINSVIKQNINIKHSRNKGKRIIKIDYLNEYYNRTTYTIKRSNINEMNKLFNFNNFNLSTSSKLLSSTINSSISNFVKNNSYNNGFKNKNCNRNCLNKFNELSNLVLKNKFLFEKGKIDKTILVKKRRKILTIK